MLGTCGAGRQLGRSYEAHGIHQLVWDIAFELVHKAGGQGGADAEDAECEGGQRAGERPLDAGERDVHS